MDSLLENKTILVTGGSGKFGRAICEIAAREGAKVAFTWNSDSDSAKETEKVIQGLGCESLSIQADLSNKSESRKIVELIENKWGHLYALVNNAAISESVPFVLISDEDIEEVMEVNFFSPFRLSREAVRSMVRAKKGRIVNISSITGSRSIPGPVHYASSKGALEAMTKSLAHEVGPYGVLVNAIAAGIFEAGLDKTIPGHHRQRYLDSCSLSRFGTPSECAELVVWLLSEKNTYINGTVIYQEGGTLS